MTGGFPEPYTFGKRLLKYLESSSPDFDVLLDNNFWFSFSNTKALSFSGYIHHPITKDHKLEMESAKNWKEKLSSKMV